MLLGTLLAAYSMPETFVVDETWSGTVDIDRSTCIDGDVTLALEAPASDGTVRGNYFYEANGDRRGIYKANYVVEGRWDGDVLTLEQVGIEVVHETTTTTWRHGRFELVRRGDSLSGRWAAIDAPCEGQVDLVED